MLDANTIQIQSLKCNWWKNICVDVLRLDELHPIISGNKWFKLKLNVAAAKALGKDTIEVIPTTAQWFGVTYKEDAPSVQASVTKLVDQQEYPNNLWAE